MAEDDIVFLDTVTAPPGSGYTDADFEDKKFMATSVPTATTITVTMGSAASGTTTNVGSCRAQTYYTVGPEQELGGFGFGTGQWSGTASGPATTTLGASIADVSTTSITLASSTAFPTSGEIRVGTEDISYTANDIATGIVSGGARGVDKLGEQIADEQHIPVTKFLADWDNYGKGAGFIRNEEMAKYADELLAVWN